MLHPGASLIDVAFAACTVLAGAGEVAVLCGGSAAAYYVPERYQSLDIDFVLQVGAAPHIVNRALATIGYERLADGFYRNAVLPYTLAFPVGPLAIGREYIRSWRTDRRGEQLLRVYTPTDVVRDRFLHYWAWHDQTALEAALAVARARRAELDLTLFAAWADREMTADRSYDAERVREFLALLETRAS
jgi:hypothetical protein